MRSTRHFFNLIEIAMSLGIVGFGVSAIMSVFPAALQNAENSIGQDYVSNASDLFISYISTEAKVFGQWDGVVVNGLPSAKPDETIDDAALIATSPIDTDSPNVFGSSDPGIYAVIQWNDINADGVMDSGEHTDFEGIVRIWTDTLGAGSINVRNTTLSSYDNSNTSPVNITTQFGVGIFTELSWPKHKPYSRREKRLFYTELSNPHSTSL